MGEPVPEETAARVAALVLAVAIAGTQLLVDPAAAAAFDAPKRLVGLAGIVVAAVAIASLAAPFGALRVRARGAAGAAAVAVLGVLVSAWTSSQTAIAVDTVPRLVLLAVAIVLGASRAFDGGRAAWPAAAVVGAAAVNAGLACVERVTGWQPFALDATTGRGASGGLIGNEGQAALLLALAAVAVLPIAIRRGRWRIPAMVALALLLVGMGAEGSLTAALALATGAAAVLLLRFRRRAALVLATVLACAVVAIAVLPPLRARVDETARHLRAGEWNAMTSYRLGPWAAAVEMVRERPLLGVGPGGFGAAFVPHRLAAEIRWRVRLDVPVRTSAYAEAHCEPLQALAEWGAPAGLAAIVAVLWVVLLTLRRAATASADVEDLVLAGVLTAAVVAALTWFPFQQPSTRLPLLLALGRAWRRAT